MSLMRSLLLAASQNQWLRERASRYRFVRRSVARFMPGETLEDALAAARNLKEKNIGAVFTHLGENVAERAEAVQVAEHYLGVMERNHAQGLGTEVSVKLTQLGLDISPDFCFENLKSILEREDKKSTVWIDMEASNYVDVTLELYRRALAVFPRAGICLQAYLHRTKDDLEKLLPLRPAVRLVKGAYKEPPEIAFPRKRDVDESFFSLTQTVLRARKRGEMGRVALGTHDVALIRRISGFAESEGVRKDDFEIHMLYGIQRGEQMRLAGNGYRSIVLVAYGRYWYAWFLRRLAERPANVWFLLRNLF
ncbi:MAG: proline dehydrogenase family protein [Acidobacteriia bacterium]|nr:proline dehydrogenase family protein [Terriglobia bacterium]